MLFDQVFPVECGMSPSSIQTLVQAVDCLDRLLATGTLGRDSPAKPGSLVDDDNVYNMACSPQTGLLRPGQRQGRDCSLILLDDKYL
jgi:hypothetical protein